MTNEQKIDPVTLQKTYFGKYVDNEYTEWDWVCAAPTAAEIAEQSRQQMAANKDTSLYRQEAWVEIMLYLTYISGAFGFLGAPFQWLFGNIAYGYMLGLLIWQVYDILFNLVGSLEDWIAGPLWRQTGWFIFWLAMINTWIPGWNIIAAPLFLWWGLYDYFDYAFDPWFGVRP